MIATTTVSSGSGVGVVFGSIVTVSTTLAPDIAADTLIGAGGGGRGATVTADDAEE